MDSSFKEKMQALVGGMEPITLEEMKSVRLMHRTDQKYVTTTAGLLSLLALTQDSYYVQENAGTRVAAYRTVYWDTPGAYPFFRNHQRGCLPRTKVRARTYEDSDQSFLEVKHKNNHGKTRKSRMQVPSIGSVIDGRVGEEFLAGHTGLSFRTLQPVVGNRFNRLTLVNKGKTERLTIDFGLRFDNFETGREAALDDVVVIELKRDGRAYSPVHAMLRELRIKPAGFSKYCMGMCYTGDGLRINNFKTRLRRIRKIQAKAAASEAEVAAGNAGPVAAN